MMLETIPKTERSCGSTRHSDIIISTTSDQLTCEPYDEDAFESIEVREAEADRDRAPQLTTSSCDTVSTQKQTNADEHSVTQWQEVLARSETADPCTADDTLARLADRLVESESMLANQHRKSEPALLPPPPPTDGWALEAAATQDRVDALLSTQQERFGHGTSMQFQNSCRDALLDVLMKYGGTDCRGGGSA